MSEGKKKVKGAAKEKGSVSEEAALRAEVAAFASQLGLASGGAGQGFDDTDFRPEKAGKRLSEGGGKKGSSKQGKRDGGRPGKKAAGGEEEEESDQPAKPGGGKRKKGGKAAIEDPSQGAAKRAKAEGAEDATDDPVRGRKWNEGAGKRPDFTSFRGAESAVWYEALEELSPLGEAPKGLPPLTEDQVEERYAAAEAVLEKEVAAAEKGRGGSDAAWLQQARKSGTTADKVAALTLLLNSGAVANLRALDELLRLVSKRSGARAVAGQAIDALREVFINALLPPTRKLRFFSEQPLTLLPTNRGANRYLLYFLVEDKLKKRFAAFIAALEEASMDPLDFLKEKALRALSELLRSRPEGEARLLAALVNKLGDPTRKLASRAGWLLGGVLTEHPRMKAVVVREVERFLFKPGLPDRAVYYAVVFLNQLPLSHRPEYGGSALAEKMVGIYFTLFRLILQGTMGRARTPADGMAEGAKKGGKPAKGAKGGKKGRWRDGGKPGAKGGRKGAPPKKAKEAPKTSADKAAEVDARMLGALLTGVRRAFPYVNSEAAGGLATVQADALFRLLHAAPFGTGVQALCLLHAIMTSQSSATDRFYRALYEALLSPEFGRSSKSALFLGLLLRALKADTSTKRGAAFAKRLLQVATQQMPNYACACLLLLSEVMKEKPALWNGILQPEEGVDEVERFVDAPDPEDEPQAPALEAEGSQGKQGARSAEVQEVDEGEDEEGVNGDSSDGEAESGGDDQFFSKGRGTGAKKPLGGQQQKVSGSPAGRGEKGAGSSTMLYNGYDPFKREPLYAGAEGVAAWELLTLAAHFHPSVASMARALLAGAPIVYNGDPIRDFSTTAFLDKFLLRKPKELVKGDSVMQPMQPRLQAAGGEENPTLGLGPAPGTAAFAELAEEDVEPDALFFHRYFQLKAERLASGAKPLRNSNKQAAKLERQRARAKAQEAGSEGEEGEGEDLLSDLDSALASGDSGSEGEDEAFAAAEADSDGEGADSEGEEGGSEGEGKGDRYAKLAEAMGSGSLEGSLAGLEEDDLPLPSLDGESSDSDGEGGAGEQGWAAFEPQQKRGGKKGRSKSVFAEMPPEGLEPLQGRRRGRGGPAFAEVEEEAEEEEVDEEGLGSELEEESSEEEVAGEGEAGGVEAEQERDGGEGAGSGEEDSDEDILAGLGQDGELLAIGEEEEEEEEESSGEEGGGGESDEEPGSDINPFELEESGESAGEEDSLIGSEAGSSGEDSEDDEDSWVLHESAAGLVGPSAPLLGQEPPEGSWPLPKGVVRSASTSHAGQRAAASKGQTGAKEEEEEEGKDQQQEVAATAAPGAAGGVKKKRRKGKGRGKGKGKEGEKEAAAAKEGVKGSASVPSSSSSGKKKRRGRGGKKAGGVGDGSKKA